MSIRKIVTVSIIVLMIISSVALASAYGVFETLSDALPVIPPCGQTLALPNGLGNISHMLWEYGANDLEDAHWQDLDDPSKPGQYTTKIMGNGVVVVNLLCEEDGYYYNATFDPTAFTVTD